MLIWYSEEKGANVPISVRLRIYPVIWGPVETHEGSDNRSEACLQAKLGFGWLRPSIGFGTPMHSAPVRTVAGIGMWNVLCMRVSLEVPFPALRFYHAWL